MNIIEIVIIYLAFGAPLAVHTYLHRRGLEFRQRVGLSILTFLFWIPTAARLGYRYLTNAYLASAFVSHEHPDASEIRLAELRDDVRSALNQANRESLPSYSLLEVLERYVGLSIGANSAAEPMAGLSSDLFDAAGRPDDKLATVCLMRRNQQRIGRHHIKARRDFLALFEDVSDRHPAAAKKAIESGLELARYLGDKKAVDGLEALAAQASDLVWNLESQPILGSISLAMKSSPLNND